MCGIQCQERVFVSAIVSRFPASATLALELWGMRLALQSWDAPHEERSRVARETNVWRSLSIEQSQISSESGPAADEKYASVERVCCVPQSVECVSDAWRNCGDTFLYPLP